ncbi:MAG: HAD-IC family P-type ATPase [Clostridioides sp.]|jgi:cation-transporting ATPase E|nr:HAD-IC family P-type ATPase [Clostridioides sp.]
MNLNSDLDKKLYGLSSSEVEERVKNSQTNKQIKSLTRTYPQILSSNILTLFNLINVIIALFIAYTRSYENMLFMGVIISNILIGIVQEIRAKISVDKLSILSQSKVSVLRDGAKKTIEQEQIVKDDVIYIKRGDQVCVDGVVIYSEGLEVDESQLTGESDAVSKIAVQNIYSNCTNEKNSKEKTFKEKTSEEKTKVYSGSFVMSGSAYIKVVNVGANSYASKLAMEANKVKGIQSEIIKTLKKIIKGLTFAILPLGILLFWSTYKNSNNINQTILSTAGAIIGMIPEGLILITSIALTVGVIKLSKRKVLVKTIGSIENLARVDLLCFDKTGTITTGNIKVKKIISNKDIIGNKEKISDKEIIVNKEKILNKEIIDNNDSFCEDIKNLLDCFSDDNSTSSAIRDFVSSKTKHFEHRSKDNYDEYSSKDIYDEHQSKDDYDEHRDKEKYDEHRIKDNYDKSGLVKVVPFSSSRKWSGATFSDKGTFIMGAYDILFADKSKTNKNEIELLVEKESELGNRIIAFAHSDEKLDDSLDIPQNLMLKGIVVLEDEIREDAEITIEFFQNQGIEVKIISGDNASTVSSIAKKVGVREADRFVDMSTVKNEDIESISRENTIFGRVKPEQKRDLVKAFKKQGFTVGMTGDGVNDILALREADCSIAMAKGSDASKEVSDFVLLESNFEAMIGVLMEGRRVINNVGRIASQYLMKTVYSTILAFIFIFIKRYPYPFQPIQLMPINALGVGVPSFFLALRPNYNKVKKEFLLDILFPAFTSGITVVVYILFILIVGNLLRFNYEQISTTCLILTATVCFVSLVKISKPLNEWIKLMLTLLIGSFALIVIVFRSVIAKSILDMKVIIFSAILMSTVLFMYKIIGDVIFFIKNETKNKKIGVIFFMKNETKNKKTK